MATDLRTLIRTRGNIKAQCTRIRTFLTSNETPNVSELQARRTRLNELRKEFETVQFEIEGIDETADHEKERDQFETLQLECFSLICQVLEPHQPNSIERQNTPSSSSSCGNACNGKSQSIAPRVKIKDFDGNYAEWNSFHDTFKSVVHEDENTPAVQKFELLKSHLKGEAFAVVSVLNPSEENYSVAWESLKETYNKPRKIIEAHIRSLFELKEASKNSPISMRSLAVRAQLHVTALKSQGEPVEWHEMLIYILTSKLDKETRNLWEQSLVKGQKPTTEDLFEFFQKYSNDSEPVQLVTHNSSNHSRDSQHSKNRPPGKPKRFTQGYVSTSHEPQCGICKGIHYVSRCELFNRLDGNERYVAARKANLCTNCLRAGHWEKQCRSSSCQKCQGRHHTLLHLNYQINEQAKSFKNEPTPSTSKACPVALTAQVSNEILLSTAKITILGKGNEEYDCRVLLDSGSQSNFITEGFARQLGLPTTRVDIPAAGLGQKATRISRKIKTIIKDRQSKFMQQTEFLILPRITSLLPSQFVDRESLKIPNQISLADPDFHKPDEIDALLGEQIFYKLLCEGQMQLGNKTAILQKTKVGWIISGSVKVAEVSPLEHKCHFIQIPLEQQLENFWRIEECAPRTCLSQEEQQCEEQFSRETTRDSTGRYIVRLPFNERKTQLGESYDIALKRFFALERKLEKNADLRKQYTAFLEEYESLGHMTLTNNTNRSEGFYLPHHAVLKQTSLTTKVRVVFDGSAKSSTGVALNDALLVGPKIQDELFALLARFRTHAVVFTADVEKMFRQILVHPEDANFQKIFWRPNKGEPVKTYKLNTVTYGTASAPFLSVRALQQLARDEGDSFPKAASVFLTDFYMDDLLTGACSLAEAKQLKTEIIALAKAGGFNLRQWASNQPQLIEDLKTCSNSDNICLESSTVKKTLGINWHPSKDEFSYSAEFTPQIGPTTKRLILSKIAQLFDPLGLLGPVVITAKIIMQDLWKSQLKWDEEVSESVKERWNNYVKELSNVTEIHIPRAVTHTNSIDIQLHGFSDASEKAYGACIYLRSINAKREVITHLLCAKSRVAPLKIISLPRLELCAALLLIKLYKTVVPALKLSFSKIRFWSDSMITLHWINTPPHTLKTFVANRVSEIQSNSNPADWSHVPSAENPADVVSRGQLPSEFRYNQQWFKGPAWLAKGEAQWPNIQLPRVDIPELKTITLVTTVTNDYLLRRFSTFTTLQRVVAYLLRFKNNALQKDKQTGPLTCKELQRAHTTIIILVQSEAFYREVNDLKNSKVVSKSSKLAMLNPFIDTEGIIRVGGRLSNAAIMYSQKHPIVLPRSHYITQLIIRKEHIRHIHAGINATLNAVRQRYWPIDGKNTTRFIVHRCLRCFKAKPKDAPSYRMGNLPKNRINAFRPFENAGIDYCGPFFVKEKRYRNQARLKVYVAVFVCFATKAVHLELVSDLTTEAFLASLKRFFARRGLSKNLYSDNATNFTGAKNELIELQACLNSTGHNERIMEYLANNSVNWHFSPPRAPHFGGLWEAAVKSFKHHMIRTIGDTLFTYEQLNSYIIEVEAILNSRPLIRLSSDPNDLNALTPSHFLIGESITSLPEHDFTDTPVNRLSLWQHIQRVKQHFWTRWHKEYLNEINLRTKWRTDSTRQLKVGELVLLKEDNLPPMRWMLGRIIDTHPGEDDIVRVVTVKTTSGTLKRSVKRLCPLPLDDDPAIDH